MFLKPKRITDVLILQIWEFCNIVHVVIICEKIVHGIFDIVHLVKQSAILYFDISIYQVLKIAQVH